MSRSTPKRRRQERSRKARSAKPSKRAEKIIARALREGLCLECSEAKEKPVAHVFFAIWNNQCRACYRKRDFGRSTKLFTDTRTAALWKARREKRA